MAWQHGVTALLLYRLIPDRVHRYPLPITLILAVKGIDETNPNTRHLAAARCLTALLLYRLIPDRVHRYPLPITLILAVKGIDETNPNTRHLAAARCLSFTNYGPLTQ